MPEMARRVTSRIAALAALLALGATAGPATATAQAQVLEGPVGGPTAAGGVLLFSRADPGTARTWRLHLRGRDGKVVRLPVAPSDDPFDADLGTTAGGRVVAVYSRCAKACRIYLLDLATNSETRLRQAEQVQRDQTHPTLHRGVLGFQRRMRGATSGGTYRLLALRPGAHSRTVKRLRSGQSVTGADLSARGLAISTAQDTADERHRVSVQVKPTGRPFRTLQTAASGAMSYATTTAPSWRGNHLLWGYARVLDAPSRLLVRARITASGATFAATTAPSALQGGGILAGVAADDLSSGAPLWVLADSFDEMDVPLDAALSAVPWEALRFGPAPKGVGLGR